MWAFTFPLDRDPDRPLYEQIARSIEQDIRRGRLRPDDRLPGTRTLARLAGVNRVTVLAAYDALAAEGWVVTHPARGTFVSEDFPGAVRGAAESGRVRGRGWTSPAYALPAGPSPARWLQPARGVLALRSSYPDTRLVRLEPLVRAYRRVLTRSGGRLLGYGEPEGHPRLRRAIAEMLRRTRALSVTTDNIMITRGSQMALALVARALLRPGDVVAIEEPGYRLAWDAFEQAGATLAPVPVDAAGLDVDALTRLVSQGRVAAVYLTPHHQLPTTATLSPGRRAALLALARAHRFVIIEDDYDHEFHFAGPPVAPIASIDPGVVLYVGTLSKVLAPGLRIGYLAAPPSAIQQLASYRQLIDMQGDPAMEAAVAELIDEDEIQRHIRRVCRIYHARRDAMAAAVTRRLGGAVTFGIPDGGIGLWAGTAADVDVETWARASLQRGVAFLTGRAFTLDGAARPFLRLGYACVNEHEIREAVDRMAAALPPARARQRRTRA